MEWGPLDFDETDALNTEEYGTLVWDIDSKILGDFRKDIENEISESKIYDDSSNEWMWTLSSNDNGIHLKLNLKSLPSQIGAVKMNYKISCEELLFVKQYNDIVMATSEESARSFLTIEYENDIEHTFSFSDFEKEKLTSLQFKFNIEILIRYDLYGGIFFEVDQPLYVSPSKLNNIIVYGYLNNMHDFDANKIKTFPLSIFKLIYEYYLMMIKIEADEGEFVWRFYNKRDVNLFLNCRKGDVITSRKFEVNGCVFDAELTPNGWGSCVPEGKCSVWLAVHSFPKNVFNVELFYRVTCEVIGYQDKKTQILCQDPNKGVYSFAPDTFMNTNDFKALKQFEFKLMAKVIRMLDSSNNQIM